MSESEEQLATIVFRAIAIQYLWAYFKWMSVSQGGSFAHRALQMKWFEVPHLKVRAACYNLGLVLQSIDIQYLQFIFEQLSNSPACSHIRFSVE